MNRSSWLKENDQVGPYVIVRRIGKGGMGEVYEAFDESLRRHVALKFMPRETADDPEMVKRFEAEGRALALVRHLNTVGVYTVGKHLGVPYIAMEYVEGAALNKYLQKNTVSLKEAIAMFFQLLEGTQSLHEHGLIHRDLKPANIIKQTSGRMKIVDFGIAKVVNDEDYEFTEVGAVLGSVKYMAPEVARGEAASVKSDIRSLGIIFYEVLIGRYPFSLPDNQLKMLEVIRNNDVEFPSDFNLPIDIKRIILKMCQKNKALRYDEVSEVIDDIARFKEGCSNEIDAYEKPDFDKTVVVIKKDKNRVIKIEPDNLDDYEMAPFNEDLDGAQSSVSRGFSSRQQSHYGGSHSAKRENPGWTNNWTGKRKPSRSEAREFEKNKKFSGADFALGAFLLVGVVLVFMEFQGEQILPTMPPPSVMPEVAVVSPAPIKEKTGRPVPVRPVVKKAVEPKKKVVVAAKSGAKLQEPVLLAPKNQEKLFFESAKFINSKVGLSFQWMGKALGEAYDLEVASDQDFKELVMTKKAVSMDVLELSLPKGKYYWRARASVDSRLSPWSSPFQFSVDLEKRNISSLPPKVEPKPARRNAPPLLVRRDIDIALNFQTQRTPAQYKQTPSNPPKFRWKRRSKFKFYEIEVASDIAFSNILFKKVTRKNLLVWKQPSPGLSFWRVRGFSKRGLASPNSEIGSVRVQLPPPLLPNSFSRKVTVKNFENVNGAPILFKAKWGKVPFASGYAVEISEARDFITTFYSEKVKSPSIRLEMPPSNRYYIKIAALDASNTVVGKYSSTTAFSLKKVYKPPRPKLLAPLDKKVEKKNSKLLLFKWGEKKGVEKYEFQLAKDRGFKNVIMDKKLILSKIYLRNPQLPNEVYWRVRAFSKKSRSKWSRPRSLTFK